MKRGKMKRNVLRFRNSEYQASSIILNNLQTVSERLRTASEKRITVIEAREDEGRNESGSGLRGQKTTDGTDAA